MRLSYLPQGYICMKSLCVNESQLQSDCVCVCVKGILAWMCAGACMCVWVRSLTEPGVHQFDWAD